MWTYQGVRNVSFSENFGYILNEWMPYSCANTVNPVYSRHAIQRTHFMEPARLQSKPFKVTSL